MYSALWRLLPGSRPLKIGQLVVLALIALTLLFGWVFPMVEPLLPGSGVTVSQA